MQTLRKRKVTNMIGLYLELKYVNIYGNVCIRKYDLKDMKQKMV